MQIRTLLHNADFLRKGARKADAHTARIRLAGVRKCVALLFVLGMCACAVWGTTYYRTAEGTSFNWINGTWETSTDGTTWTTLSGTPAINAKDDDVVIILRADTTCAAPLSGNNNEKLLSFCYGPDSNPSATVHPVEIHLNGFNLTVTDGAFYIGSKHTGNCNPYSGTVTIYGNEGSGVAGKVMAYGLDTTDGASCTLNLRNGVEFHVQTSYYGNLNPGMVFTINADADSKLYIPASGANVNYGSNQITYVPDNSFVLPEGTPSTYTITMGTNDPTSGETTFTFNRSSSTERGISFYYAVSEVSGTWTFNGKNYSTGNTYAFDTTSDRHIDIGANGTSASTTLKTTSGASSTIVITFWTPDNTLKLGEYRWVPNEITWKGGASGAATTWANGDNWTNTSGSGPAITDEVIIPADKANYPVLTGTVEVGSVSIKNFATVNQSGGTFTVNNITTGGLGKFVSTGGTVSFKGTDAVWEAEYPSFSNFTNVTVPTGAALTLNSDLYLKGNLTVSGTLDQNGKTIIFNGSGTQTLTGVSTIGVLTIKSGATLQLSDNLSVGTLTVDEGATLDCNGYNLTLTDSSTIKGTVKAAKFIATGLGGKTLTINGTVEAGTSGSSAMDTLKLEGSSTSSKLTVTGTGTIKINASQAGGKWVDVSSGSVPPVKDLSGGTTVTFIASYSSGPATNPTGWQIFTGSSTYTWTGAANTTAWNTAGNWDTGEVPQGGSTVVIDTASTGKYPVTPGTALSIVSLTVEDGTSITLGANLSISGELTNAGTIDTGSYGLTFGTLSDSGTIKVGTAGSLSAGTASQTVNKLVFTAGRTFSGFTNISINDAELTTGTLTLGAALSIDGELTNAGTIDTNGKNLSFDTLTDSGTIKVAAAGNLSAGTASQTVNKLVFTAGRTANFSGFTNISINDAELTTGTLTLGANLSIDGELTNAGTIDTNGKNLSFDTLTDSGTIKVAAAGTLSAGTASQTVNKLVFTAGRTANFSGFTNISINDAELTTGTLTLGAALSISGELTNAGTIVAGNNALSFSKCTGSGTIKLGASGTLTQSGTGSSFSTLQFTAGPRTFPAISDATFVNVIVDTGVSLTTGSTTLNLTGDLTNNGTLTLGANLSISGELTNAGTIDTGSYGLTFGTLSDSGTIKVGTAGSLSAGTAAQTVNSLVFTAGRTFSGFSNISINDAELTTGTLTLGNTVTFGGTFTNGGTVSIDGSSAAKTLTATKYEGSGGYSVKGTVTIKSTGTSAALAGTVASVTTAGTTTFTQTGNYAITAFTVDTGNALTLGSALSAGTLINNGTINITGNNLTYTTYTPSGTQADVVNLSGTVQIYAGTSGKISTVNYSHTTNNNLRIRNNTINIGNLNISGTGGAVTLRGTINADAVTILSGNTTIGNTTNNDTTVTAGTFTATGLGGSTLTVNRTLSITGTGAADQAETLLLSGTSSSKLTVTGSATGVIKLNASQINGDYLTLPSSSGPEVQNSSGGSTVVYTAIHSTATSTAPSGWNLCSGALTYNWTGASNTAWGTAANWATRIVPGTTDDVVIPSVTNAPVTPTAETTVNSLDIKSSASITLGGNFIVNNSTGSVTYALTNAGTIDTNGKDLTFKTLSDTGTIKVAAAGNLSAVTANQTVNKLVFTAGRTANFSGFGNISIKDLQLATGTLTLGANLSISGRLTNGGTIDTNGNDLSFATLTDSGTIKVAAAGNLSAVTANQTVNKLVFTAGRTANFSGFNNIRIKDLQLATGTLTLGANLSISGELTNTGTIDTNGKDLSFATLTDTGTIKVGATNALAATSTTSQTVNSLIFTAGRTFSGFSNISINDAELTTGTLTLGSSVTFGGTFTNGGTVSIDGSSLAKTLKAKKYAGSGGYSVKGTVTIESTGTSSDSGSLAAVTVTGNTSLSTSGYAAYPDVNVSSGILTLQNDITIGALTNAAVINTNSHTLTFSSITDTGTIQLAGTGTLAVASGGSVGTINNLQFTVNRTYADITGLTFKNAIIDLGKELKAGSGGLSFTGTVTNNGSINVDNRSFTCGTYSGNGSDEVHSNGGTFTAAGGTIHYAQLNSSSKIINNGSGNIVFDTVEVTADNSSLTATNSNNTGTLRIGTTKIKANATLKTEKTGTASNMPVLTNVMVDTGKTLTLGSNLAVSSTLTNNGTISSTSSDPAAGYSLSCATYTKGSGVTSDKLTLSGTLGVTVTSGQISLVEVTGTTTLSGSFECARFQATGLSDKTLTLNGTVTVGRGAATSVEEETLKLSGADGHKLSVNGTGSFRLNTSQNGGQYLTVSTAGPSIKDLNGSTETIFTATYSASTSSDTEFNGWNICAGELIYIWKGGDGSTAAERTNWNGKKNWTVRIVPRPSSKVDIPATAGYDVVIPSAVEVTTLSVGAGKNLSLAGNLTVTAGLSNDGTINVNNRAISFSSYSGSGLVQLGNASTLSVRSGGSGGIINSLEYTGNHSFEAISNLSINNVKVDGDVELTLLSDLTLTDAGALTNNGTIIMNSRNLTFKTYADTSSGGVGLVKLGSAGNLVPTGSGGTINNLEFTETRNYRDIANLTFVNGIVDEAKIITISGGNLTFTGTLTNKGTINVGANALSFKTYGHTGVLNDTITISGGSITAASGGNGTGMVSVSVLTMNGSATVTNNSSGALKFADISVNADATLTSNGSGSAPVFTRLSVTGSSVLTLASDLTVSDITIGSSATLNADNRGKNPNPDFEGWKLTVRGDFINNNSTPADTESVVYHGFIPQSGEVIFTGNGSTTHKIKGNNKFNDLYCHEAGATLLFDVGTTTNVDHQIDLAGSAGNLITVTTDSAVEGEKWTLDVVWDVAEGTPEHPKPKIKYVAPHKSISYSAILKGCLDNCVDDVTELLDSTNVNWFNDMPTILMTLAPVGGKQLFVMFSTEVSAAPGRDLRTALKLKTATGSTSIIDPSVPLTTFKGNTDKSKSAVIFGLTRELTWNDLYGSDCLHLEVVETSAIRVGTTRISYQAGIRHVTSDFAINAARMLVGFDNYIDSSTPLTIEKGTNSVRTWDQSDLISNRLHSDSDLLFQAQFDQSVPEGTKLEMIAMNASQLNSAVIGDNYGDYYDLTTRLWLPEAFQPVTTSDQPVPAAQKIGQDSTSSGRLRNFSLHYNKASSAPLFKMQDGEEIQFLFKVKNADGSDLMIDHDYDEDNGIYTPTPRRPVYAIRLVDDADISTIDLWSVMLQSTTMQRGNVTILNNVINSDHSEETFVTIQMQKAGSLTVQVLTLDGAVVTTLQRGRKQAGTWGYSWNGTNGKGKPVARGMYFIRVIGPDIDETRKVMVVRD